MRGGKRHKAVLALGCVLLIAVTAERIATTKTLRRRFFSLAGRLTRLL